MFEDMANVTDQLHTWTQRSVNIHLRDVWLKVSRYLNFAHMTLFLSLSNPDSQSKDKLTSQQHSFAIKIIVTSIVQLATLHVYS